MKQEAVKEIHYGAAVAVNPTTEPLRKTECLCLNCTKLVPDSEANCHIAKDLYRSCCQHNVALMVTRCPEYSPKPRV